MSLVTATYAKNNIGDIWELIKQEPVEVRSNGVPVAFVVSPEQYYKLQDNHSGLGRRRRLGLLSEEFRDVDWEKLHLMDITETFSDYMP